MDYLIVIEPYLLVYIVTACGPYIQLIECHVLYLNQIKRFLYLPPTSHQLLSMLPLPLIYKPFLFMLIDESLSQRMSAFAD